MDMDCKNRPIGQNIIGLLNDIKTISGNSSDVMHSEFCLGGIRCVLLGCEGMYSNDFIADWRFAAEGGNLSAESLKGDGNALLSYMNDNMLLAMDTKEIKNYGELFSFIHAGFIVLAAEGADKAMAFGAQGYSSRSVSSPSGEINITGSQEGFVEVVRVNMSMLRRRLKSPEFVMELMKKGSKSGTDICLCYMQDRVPKDLLQQIKDSLDKVDTEAVLTTGYISPFLEAQRLEIFPSTGTTERPDVLCSKLIEGRVAVLIDGIPFAIIIPRLFCESFQTLDDYSFKPVYAVFMRWLKYFAFFITILLPGFYVAISLHHPEMLNSRLLMLLVEGERNSPVALIIEAFGVLVMYEIIREAGLRLPKAVGGAVSIVAGLIIGEAAVSSGLISTPMLTVAALSVTSGFVIPELAQSITVLRFSFLIAGGLLGLFGIGVFGSAVLLNICATETYGFPFTSPLSPFKRKAMRDTVGRVGFRKMQKGNFTVEELR